MLNLSASIQCFSSSLFCQKNFPFSMNLCHTFCIRYLLSSNLKLTFLCLLSRCCLFGSYFRAVHFGLLQLDACFKYNVLCSRSQLLVFCQPRRLRHPGLVFMFLHIFIYCRCSQSYFHCVAVIVT